MRAAPHSLQLSIIYPSSLFPNALKLIIVAKALGTPSVNQRPSILLFDHEESEDCN